MWTVSGESSGWRLSERGNIENIRDEKSFDEPRVRLSGEISTCNSNNTKRKRINSTERSLVSPSPSPSASLFQETFKKRKDAVCMADTPSTAFSTSMDESESESGSISILQSPSSSDMDEVDDDIDDDIDIDADQMIEKLWAKEQYETPQYDREATTDEMHGVKSRYDVREYEKAENHYQALIMFDNELNNPNSDIPFKLKNNYLKALRLNSTYVSSSYFRLRFLRTEFFDVRKAIIRFCKCLNLLVEYFGDNALLRQIFLSDLTKSERKLLKEGAYQLSPSRDSLGRRTLFFLGLVGANYSPRERDRVGIFLIFQILAEDVTTQQNGLVTIHMLTADVMRDLGGENTPKMSTLFLSIFEACPLRFSAVHMCFPGELVFRLLKPLMLFLVGHSFRKVLKFHTGTPIECNYSLSSFGVRQDDIPITYSGTIKTRQHMRWLKVRVAMDEYVKHQCKEYVNGDYRYFYASDKYTIRPFPHIQCPEINCVLFHKNGVAWEFPGNIKFRAFLDDQLPNNSHLNSKASSNPKPIGSVNAVALVAPKEKEGLFDRIIRLSLAQNFHFLLHDESKHWYIELKELGVLRRYIGFAIRGRQRRVSARKQQYEDTSDDNNNKNNVQNSNTTNKSPAVFTNMDGKMGSYGPDGCFSLMR